MTADQPRRHPARSVSWEVTEPEPGIFWNGPVEPQPVAGSPSELCVFIKILWSKTFAAPASLDHSVREREAKLEAQDSSQSPKAGMLLYNSRQVEETLTLRRYEIIPNSFVYPTLICKCRVPWGR